MDVYKAIEARHGFAIPDVYRRLKAEGAFELRNLGLSDPENEPTFVWIPEAEWMEPE
jgi:hypothetical protein